MRGNLRPRFIDGSDDELIAAAMKHDEAEDVVQTAYMRALTKLDGFHGGSRLSTWLGRIVLNEALGRMRRERPVVDLATIEHAISAQVVPFPLRESSADPEQTITLEQTRPILEGDRRAARTLPNCAGRASG